MKRPVTGRPDGFWPLHCVTVVSWYAVPATASTSVVTPPRPGTDPRTQSGLAPSTEIGLLGVTKNCGSTWRSHVVSEVSGLSGIGCASTDLCFATVTDKTKGSGYL